LKVKKAKLVRALAFGKRAAEGFEPNYHKEFADMAGAFLKNNINIKEKVDYVKFSEVVLDNVGEEIRP